MKIKRALISVSKKDGLEDFAKVLAQQHIEIISTGGTSKFLEDREIPVRHVETVTSFPHILNGRVKTLHPVIFGGILALRKDPLHLKELIQYQIPEIDLVVCNLYPFQETVANEDVSLEDALENIDIGGVTLIRAAAKNFPDVLVIVNQEDYPTITEHITQQKEISISMRAEFALKAFKLTALYDAAISDFLEKWHTRIP